MNYLIAVFPDRIAAEAAYTSLEGAGLPMNQVTILGRGYKTADEFGLIDPNQKAREQAKLMAVWLVPFGFVAGFTFNAITHINLFTWTNDFGNHLIGGLLGAMGGGMGSVFVGGGVGISSGSGDALPYRNRLNAGKYLVAVKGSKAIQQRATAILEACEPENLQGYFELT
ncbi:MAG: hypothetical protein EA366_01525 [Spirulina sp. DLM2.Bin59]|nr:MAG: hypothetical protein EA366_01525 [Spirulina sp. DLM2.Bin59]